MEPPREADGMDQELAAALGIQISDERTQEANVLGARLATGVPAPPRRWRSSARASLTVKTRFRKKRSKTIGLAGDGDRASVLRAAFSAWATTPSRPRCYERHSRRSGLQRSREPVVEQPRMSLRDHRRAERQRAMANGLEIAKPCPGAARAAAGGLRGCAAAKGADAWRPLGAAQPAKRRRRAPSPAPAPSPRRRRRPTRSRAPSVACAWPSPTRGAPTPRWTRTSSAAAAAAPGAPPPMRKSPRKLPSDASEDARRALELREAASSSRR